MLVLHLFFSYFFLFASAVNLVKASSREEEMARAKAKIISNFIPSAKHCFLCLPGTVSTPECMGTGNISLYQENNDNTSCAEGYCAGSASNCSICPAGTFSDGLNRFGRSECTNCSFGFYSKYNKSTACKECEPRFYCPSNVNTEMVPCPIGGFCNVSQLSNFFVCPPGYFCPKEELKEPIICTAGFFCRGGTESPKPCPENMKCPAGTSIPIPCPSLFISDKKSADCSPTIAFWVIVAISIISIFIFFGWIFFKISSMAMMEQEEIKSQEITKIIPPANGPRYTGL